MEQHCLCKSHFPCILCPATLSWRQAAKIAGQVTLQRLNMSDFLCNDNAIEHTVCSSHKRGHINKKRFGVKVRTIGTTFSTGWAYSDTLKRAFPPWAEHSLWCRVGGCLHHHHMELFSGWTSPHFLPLQWCMRASNGLPSTCGIYCISCVTLPVALYCLLHSSFVFYHLAGEATLISKLTHWIFLTKEARKKSLERWRCWMMLFQIFFLFT